MHMSCGVIWSVGPLIPVKSRLVRIPSLFRGVQALGTIAFDVCHGLLDRIVLCGGVRGCLYNNK